MASVLSFKLFNGHTFGLELLLPHENVLDHAFFSKRAYNRTFLVGGNTFGLEFFLSLYTAFGSLNSRISSGRVHDEIRMSRAEYLSSTG